MSNKSVFSEMWDSYKVVILRSLVTTFGLDFIIRDRIGGDVDTIHNVRNGVEYKNPVNKIEYVNRGDYDPVEYHNHPTYNQLIKDVKNIGYFEDSYISGNKIMYSKASYLKENPEHKANLDHVIAAKRTHDDPGRVLAGLDGKELANKEWNLKFTNESLNKSVGKDDIEQYIQKRRESGDPLPKEVEERMLNTKKTAESNYEKELNKYYLSSKFYNDAILAAANVGLRMGIRQVLGFLFLEVWFACEKEIKNMPVGSKFADHIAAIKRGIEKGFDNARKNYKELLAQFGEGFIAGIFASILTTLINIFVTTKIIQARAIRQAFVTVVQAGRILFFNPNDDLLGDQVKKASCAIVTGASMIAGIYVGGVVEYYTTAIPYVLRGTLTIFTQVLVGGLLSCTILILLDRSRLITSIIDKLNEYGTLSAELRIQLKEFERIACEIENVNLDSFLKEKDKFQDLINRMTNAKEEEINDILLEYFKENNIELPWEGEFDDFMNNSDNRLKFGF